MQVASVQLYSTRSNDTCLSFLCLSFMQNCLYTTMATKSGPACSCWLCSSIACCLLSLFLCNYLDYMEAVYCAVKTAHICLSEDNAVYLSPDILGSITIFSWLCKKGICRAWMVTYVTGQLVFAKVSRHELIHEAQSKPPCTSCNGYQDFVILFSEKYHAATVNLLFFCGWILQQTVYVTLLNCTVMLTSCRPACQRLSLHAPDSFCMTAYMQAIVQYPASCLHRTLHPSMFDASAIWCIYAYAAYQTILHLCGDVSEVCRPWPARPQSCRKW